MITYFDNKIVICANNDRLFIGKVTYLSKDMKTCILKDARVIILKETDINQFTLNDVVSAAADLTSFNSICSTMTTPIPSIGIADVLYILEVEEVIKNIYSVATKNDRSNMKDQNTSNSPDWATKKTSNWKTSPSFL